MGKIKVFIFVAVAVIAIFFIAGAIQNSDRKPDEYTLIFEGDNKAEVWVDIAIQGEDGVMYLASMLLKDSAPMMRDVVETRVLPGGIRRAGCKGAHVCGG